MASAKFKNGTTIQTERLRLRPLKKEDVEFIWSARSYREIYKWTIAGQWLEKSQADDWIRNALDTETNYNFIIELTSAGNPNDPNHVASEPEVVGSIGLFGDNELGYLFHPSHWGKGYATEAVAAFMRAVWAGLPEVQKVHAEADAENPGSLAVLRKCGFVEGRREEYENVTMGKRISVGFVCERPSVEG